MKPYRMLLQLQEGNDGKPMTPTVSINSDEEYAAAVARVRELEFKQGYSADDAEFLALTEAMLKWEMRTSAFSEEE